MSEWLLLILATGLTFGTAVFVAAEFSLVALDRPTVQGAYDAGHPRAGSGSPRRWRLRAWWPGRCERSASSPRR